MRTERQIKAGPKSIGEHILACPRPPLQHPTNPCFPPKIWFPSFCLGTPSAKLRFAPVHYRPPFSSLKNSFSNGVLSIHTRAVTRFLSTTHG